MRNRVVQGAVAAAAAVALLAGCSSGHSKPSVSKDQVKAKLASDSEFATLKDNVDATKFDTLVGCLADYLYSKGRGSDIDKYVQGKESLDDIKGYASEDNAKQAGKDCAAKAGIPTS